MSARVWIERGVGARRLLALLQALNALKRGLRPKLEPEAARLADLVPRGGVALDVGANYGQYTRVLAACVGREGVVHAFEPARTTFRCLRRNVRVLRLRNVRLWNAALAEKPGEAAFHVPVKGPGRYGPALASLVPPQGAALVERVEVRSIDALTAAGAWPRVDFVRCDVEGAEGALLRGARATLARWRPPMLIEFHPRLMARMGDDADESAALLRALGYTLMRLAEDGLAPLAGTPEGNVFCLPPDETGPAP